MAKNKDNKKPGKNKNKQPDNRGEGGGEMQNKSGQPTVEGKPGKQDY